MKVFTAGLALPVAVAAVAVMVVLLGLWAGGFPPVAVLREWFLGAVGSRAQWAASLQEACPLLLTGLAAGVAFRSGGFEYWGGRAVYDRGTLHGGSF